ncbi:MAG: spermidine synthase [SAR324 cluster bacterium]
MPNAKGTARSAYVACIVLSSFLLFEIEPLFAKTVLPYFGGSSSVWTVALMLYQALLLLGYGYAHAALRPRVWRMALPVHVALAVASGIWMLLMFRGAGFAPGGGLAPVLGMIAVFGTTICVPYFLLATTGPLVQVCYAAEGAGAPPYWLFGVSNLASLLGLLAYPTAIEPVLTLNAQWLLWGCGFGVYLVLIVGVCLRGMRLPLDRATALPCSAVPDPSFSRTPWRRWGAWCLLAVPAALLLAAVTSNLTHNVAPIPLLWVIPLALYLLTFALTFQRRSWYARWLWLPVLLAFAGGLTAFRYLELEADYIGPAMLLNLGALFATGMVCHGELAQRQPPRRHLTAYYLAIATGGALGGLFTGVAAPLVFSDYYELEVGLVLAGLAVCVAFATAAVPRKRFWRTAGAGVGLAALALAGVTVYKAHTASSGVRIAARNFYGTLKVEDIGVDKDLQRMLYNGKIIHGMQFQLPGRQRWATTYYGPDTAVGTVLKARSAGRPRMVGIVGLGAGTLAAYCRPGDRYRFYEINPLVPEIARGQFSYLAGCTGVDIVVQDARLAMQAEPSQQFDVLAVDAFSGDSIPVHLLTLEAFAVYLRHLAPRGVLALHITNRYLDLQPVLRGAARRFGLTLHVVDTPEVEGIGVYRAIWALMSRAGDRQGSAEPDAPLRQAGDGGDSAGSALPWRDDFSSLAAVVDWAEVVPHWSDFDFAK